MHQYIKRRKQWHVGRIWTCQNHILLSNPLHCPLIHDNWLIPFSRTNLYKCNILDLYSLLWRIHNYLVDVVCWHIFIKINHVSVFLFTWNEMVNFWKIAIRWTARKTEQDLSLGESRMKQTTDSNNIIHVYFSSPLTYVRLDYVTETLG